MPCKPCLANPHKTLRELVENVDKLTPEMNIGQEYPTGRYFMGQPIYTKVYQITEITTGRMWQFPTGTPGNKIVYAEFVAYTSTGSFKPEPFINASTGEFMGGLVSINNSGTVNYYFHSEEAASYTIYLVVEYIK